MASIAGLRGSNGLGAYGISKAADMQLARSLAVEWGKHNIRVNCIAPGVLDTQMMWSLPKKRLVKLCEAIPLKRLGEPREIAHCVAFLASRECSYATGATFDINGGWLMI